MNPSFVSLRHQNHRLLRCFTLVELLVVICIIVILASLSMVGLQRAIQNAQASKCSGNLNNVYVAIGSYMLENDGFLPPLADSNGKVWDTLLQNMMVGQYQTNVSVYRCASSAFNHTRYGYNANISGNGTATNGPMRMLTIVNPSNKVLLGCVEKGKSIACNVAAGGNNKMADVHNNRAMILFADGHVQARNETDFNRDSTTPYTTYFDPTK